MKIHIALFVIFSALAIILGPFIASTGGADIIQILANIIIFTSLALMLLFGILAAKKSPFGKGLKAGIIILVLLATFAAFIAVALQM
ncbi:MAG: hypothetical protein P8J32_03695 [bacterium]|jgi:hypothetical protein|nr:hypothetical protein [bacterium]